MEPVGRGLPARDDVDPGQHEVHLCYEGTTASARAWLEVASVGYLAWRASI
jgi:hypothetical protein